MRIIKFRVWAWDTEINKIVVYIDKIDFREGYAFYCDEKEEWQRVRLQHLMQYTGLLDKNKKEIYEGDIVKFNNLNCVVKQEFGAWVGSYFGSNELIFFNELANDNNDFEIIGNIYEDLKENKGV